MKRISPVLVVGFFLSVACFGLYVSGLPFILAISNYGYDAFLKQSCQPAQSGRVVIVDLDDFSLQKIGQWPWSRDMVAELTRQIFAAGASVVAFDIIFPETDRTSPIVYRQEMLRRYLWDIPLDGLNPDLRDFDQVFAKALGGGKTVVGCAMISAGVGGVSTNLTGLCLKDPKVRAIGRGPFERYVRHASRIEISIEALRNAATANAFFDAEPDADGILRSNPLIVALQDKIYPSLALEAIRLHLNAEKSMVVYDESGIREVRIGDLVVPTDGGGRIPINFRKAEKDERTELYSSFTSYPAATVLKGELRKGALNGKIVVVGASAVGLRDLKTTPICSDFPGMQVHATMIDNMLAGDVLQFPKERVLLDAASILLVGLFITIIIHKGRSWISFLVAAGIIAGPLFLSFMYLKEKGVVFMPTWCVISVVMLYPILTTIKYWEEERQRKRVREMFGTMVSKEVLHFMERNPKSFSLSGHKAEATMFFSDIAGFATISESLPPDRVSDLLNKYLSPMTQIIMDSGGYVDKYEGDLIMAEWGVPFPSTDHAAKACLAALGQQEKLRELRPALKAEFGHDIHVRMGVNSGTVTAGNMGSDRRFQYTVLGNAVNLASRFEPANKDYQTSIIIGEATYAAAKEAIEGRLLDRIVVKGISRPVEVYELLGPKGQTIPGKMNVVRLYETALRLHWDRKWDEALSQLTEALALDPSDGPSLNLSLRIHWYQENPPREGWQGEYVRVSKD